MRAECDTSSRASTLPPVQLRLPRELLAPFSLLVRAHGAQLRECESAGGAEVRVSAEPQLRLALLADWARVYRHRLVSIGGRGLRLQPEVLE